MGRRVSTDQGKRTSTTTHSTKQSETMKNTIAQLLSFIKQLRVLAWLELFEKWFGFFVKSIWISAFVAFGIYLFNEYHKNVFYLKDFKVPSAWAEQGYTGEVVKESILDEIDKIKEESYERYWGRNTIVRSTRNKDNDNTQILSDINVEGFNLKVIIKTMLSLLGKKDKNIGGYVTITDSSQTLSLQITNQLTKKFSIGRHKPIKNLIHDATLHIMRIKQPSLLLIYYQAKNDTVAVNEAYNYLVKYREVTRDYDFYNASYRMSIFVRDFDKADAWADSLLQKFPDDISGYLSKAGIGFYKVNYSNIDSLEKIKYNRIYVENLEKATSNRTNDGEKASLEDVYLRLSGYYFSQKNEKLGKEYTEKSNAIEPLNAASYNFLGYVYIRQKNYTKAEPYIINATNEDPENANYWDSLGELYALQGKDSLSVVNLKKALKAPVRIITVSIEAYKKDPRWQKLRKRKDFQALLRK
jgi:tetratricopeptide (TPR) repeat protein